MKLAESHSDVDRQARDTRRARARHRMSSAPADTKVAEYRFKLPPDATEIFVVRHGASADAVPGEPYPFLGKWSDPDLSPAGREQAERIAERLVHEPIAAIYVSTLTRTHQTAAPILPPFLAG